MNKLLFLSFSLIALQVSAQEVYVSAEGFGENYDWAVLNAVENAVRQTSDISIENNEGLNKVDVTATATHEKLKSGGSNFSASLQGDLKGKLDETGDINYQQQHNYHSSEADRVISEIKDNSKSIPAKYKGVVSSYQVVEHRETEGKTYVKINALVYKDCRSKAHCVLQKEDCSCYICEAGYKLVGQECLPCADKEVCGCTEGKKWSVDEKQCVYDAHDYKSKNIVKKADYSLAIIPFKAKKSFTCVGKQVAMAEINDQINNLYMEYLTPSRKFNMLDRSNFDSYAEELSLISDNMTLPENKVRFQNVVPADYILVGTIDNFSASTTKKTIEMTGETIANSSAQLKISYRVLETATMEVISAGSTTKQFEKKGNFSSCFNIENHLLKQAIEESVDKILSDVFPEDKPKAAAQKAETKKAKAAPAQKKSDTGFKLPFDD